MPSESITSMSVAELQKRVAELERQLAAEREGRAAAGAVREKIAEMSSQVSVLPILGEVISE